MQRALQRDVDEGNVDSEAQATVLYGSGPYSLRREALAIVLPQATVG